MARGTRTHVRAATATAVLCALLAGSGCTGGDGDGDGKPHAAAQPKKLKKAWETPLAQGAGGIGTVWADHGVLALRDKDRLLGYDARTGKLRWTLKPPKGTSGVCGMSDRPNAAGLGGLFFTTGKAQRGCTYAGAVDVADGEVTWSRRVGTMKGTYGSNDISIGDEVLTVTVDCYGVKQYRPQDGIPLGTRLKADRACAHDVDHNGRHLAVREAPAGDAKEVVPGWMPAADGAPAHFALYEGAGRKPLWRTKAHRVGDELHGIVSDDPVVLDITREGHRLLQTYDADGHPVHTIGKQLNGQVATGPYAHGDMLVIGYGRDPALYGYDLDTGKVRWKRRQEGRVLGVWKDRLLAVRQMQGPRGLPVPWLVTYGMRDGRKRTIGRIAEAGVQTQPPPVWDDERIYLRRAGLSGKQSVVAYPLPRSGGDTRHYGGEPAPGTTQVQTRGWRKGDLRPDAVANACEAVSPTAQKAMRVYRKGMPPPAGCAWTEHDTPRHADRSLTATVTAHQPGGDEGSGGSRPTPALTVAEKEFRDFGRGENADNDDKVLAHAHRLDGLGDEAKASAYTSVADSTSWADILVRYHNVTVRVEARTEALPDALRGEVPPGHRVEAAARVAAADVLGRLGAEVPANAHHLAPPAGGRITEAEPVCERLRTEAAALLPGIKARDTTPKDGSDGRTAGCAWESDAESSPSLSVRVKATPDSPLTGKDAARLAEADVTADAGAAFPGLGDEARIDRDSFTFKRTGDMNRDCRLTARKDNLVVLVEYARWGHPARAQIDEGARRVARRVLSAY